MLATAVAGHFFAPLYTEGGNLLEKSRTSSSVSGSQQNSELAGAQVIKESEKNKTAVAQPTPPSSAEKEFNTGNALLRSGVFLILLWAAWFSARQFGHTSRLLEDYAFKQASVKAFQALAIDTKDEAIQHNIYAHAMATLSDNPVRIFNISSEPATPLQEIVEAAKKLTEAAKDLKLTEKKN